MAAKNKDVIIAFFGQEIKKEPFLIETQKTMGEKQEILKKENKPQVLIHAMDNTVFGETFNKVFPTTEPYLKAMYNNSHYKSRFEAATDIAVDNLELSFKMKMKGPVPTQDLEESIKLGAKTRRAPKPPKM